MRPGGTSPGKTLARAKTHTDLMAGMAASPNEPIPGHYKRRLVKDGVWVPARVWVEDPKDPATGDVLRDPETGELMADQRICCVVWGEGGATEVDAFDVWTWLTPITKAAFDSMVATMEWARGTTAPEGNPQQAVDLRRAPPIF